MKNREPEISTALSKTVARWDHALTLFQDLTPKPTPHRYRLHRHRIQKLAKGEKGKRKDVGGHHKNGRRCKDNVLVRSLVTRQSPHRH